MKIHDCSAVCILSLAIAMENSLAEIKGARDSGSNDRKRLSMQMSKTQAEQLEQLEELDSIRIKTMLNGRRCTDFMKVFCSTENCYI